MRVLGIDTSLTATGLARIDFVRPSAELAERGNTPGWTHVISTATVGAPKPTKDRSKQAMCVRVNALIDQIEGCFSAPGETPDAVGMEALAYGARGDSAWVLPWVFGRVIELTVEYAVPLYIVGTTARAKFATGKGNADKDTVLLAAARQFPQAELRNNNEADALIVGAVVCQKLGRPILPVTAYRTEVLAKVEG